MSDLRFFDELGAELEQAAQRPQASRRPRLWAALGASGAALAGGIVAAVLLLSTGAPAAYAGWSRVPTTPSPSALETAVHRCYKVGSNAQLALPAPGGTMQPVLAEARGASAAAIYVVDSSVYMCLTVNESLFSSVDSDLMGPSLRAVPGMDQLSIPYGVSGGSGHSGPTHRLSSAQLRKFMRERLTARRLGSPLFDAAGDFALGQAGSDVSAVTFAFANRRTVVASIEHGWYFAWWPWMTEPTSVTITTATGTTTSPMGRSPHNGFGTRPYPACQPGSSGCVFAANRPAGSSTTSTSSGATTAPTSGSQVARATRTCDAFGMSTQAVPADVFVRQPALTQVHGIYTALVNVSNGRVYGCLTGGNQADVRAFFDEDLIAFGAVGATPQRDRLSVPNSQEGEGGGGRIFARPPGRHASQVELEARQARVEGGGYGPYTLGRAGRGVSAVKFSFANGKTIDATVQNGWYFAWWPWVSNPTLVVVRTSSGTIRSPLIAGTNGRRGPIAPGCRPGSHGCVFARATS